jgi:hypothetical protein
MFWVEVLFRAERPNATRQNFSSTKNSDSHREYPKKRLPSEKDSHLEQQRRLSPSPSPTPRASLLDRHSSRYSARLLAADHHRSPAAPTYSPEFLYDADFPRSPNR